MTRAEPPREVGRRRAETIPHAVRAELDQTPEWWDAQYRTAISEAFMPVPFDPAEHDGHALVEFHRYGGTATVVCTECPTRLTPRRPPAPGPT